MPTDAVASIYTGSRACPTVDAAKNAIATLRHSADELAHLKLDQELSNHFVTVFNQGILYLVWHQMFAIATRGIRLPYIPLCHVAPNSGKAVLTDKDSGTGHKDRLVYLPAELIRHMEHGERIVVEVARRQFAVNGSATSAPLFFLNEEGHLSEITPQRIEDLCADFFPFPSNTPRRMMRFLLREGGLSAEMIEVFMGHWHERREPWGSFSSFNYAVYLSRLQGIVPEILKSLGFKCPRRRGE